MKNNTLPNSFSQNSRRGAALLLAIFALLVVGTTTLAFTASRQTNFLSSRNAVNSIRVRELADSGLDLAKSILRSDTTSWRTNHTNGKLLNNYALDGGTVTVSLIDIAKRDSGASAAASIPTSTTNEVEITVKANRDGATWTSVSNMGIATTTKGQYAIFANKFLKIDGDRNQIGRWLRAPLSSEKRRINIGNQGDLGIGINSGVYIDSDVQFESAVLPIDASDPRTLKSTWIYYAYSGGTDVTSNRYPINGPGRDLVSVVRMNSDDVIRMISLPAPVAANPAKAPISGFTNNQAVTLVNGTYTFSPFCVGKSTGSQNLNLTTTNCKLKFTAGTYEIYGSWIATNTTIQIEGAVKIIVIPLKKNSGNNNNGIEWTSTTVELLSGADLEVNNAYGLSMNKCWIGSYYHCDTESDSVKATGDPHMKTWNGSPFQTTACDEITPDEPRYLEPWRVRIYSVVIASNGNSTSQSWTLTDTSVIGSLFLPDNTINLFGKSQLYGRIAADSVFIEGTSRLRYDHALDDIAGLTTGRAPNRGSDPDETFAIRLLRWGPDKGTGP